MSDELPLNVQCAKALGCHVAVIKRGNWTGYECGCRNAEHAKAVMIAYGFDGRLRDYGEDSPSGWSCTGPLLVRFGLLLSNGPSGALEVWGYNSHGAPQSVLIKSRDVARGVAEWVSTYVKEGKT